ncbi:MAG: transglutaminase domain-containing protein [Actinobacteria bacterium]|nr:transglutaminase domain-containing protein [Actinomycetota bacterium]
MGSEARARLGLAGLLLATLAGFNRVFDAGDFFGPALLGMALAWAILIAARAKGIRAHVTALVSAAALLWYLAVVFESPSVVYGLPTGRTFGGLALALGRIGQQSQLDYAPVPVRPGYMILVVVGMWGAATLAELASFVWRRPLLASLPCVILFAVALIFGNRTGAFFFVALWLGALLTYWALESSYLLRSWGSWVSTWHDGPEDEAPSSITGGIARGMGATCVAAALIAPVLLPSFGGGMSWRSGSGGSGSGGNGAAVPGGVIDHLVSMKPRLVARNPVALFSVRSPEPSYWRLITLANFDGVSWQPLRFNGTDVASGGFSEVADVPPQGRRVTQSFTIQGLGGQLLPAAPQPVAIATDEDIYDETRVDPTSGYLQLYGNLGPGRTYSVVSSVPDVGYKELRGERFFDHPLEDYSQLPPDLDVERVRRIAADWSEGADTPLDRLLALQDRLREFRYNLYVEDKASSDYLLRFLTRTREGYCQQFATAFAVLARTLGFSTRVSVGFLPGAPSPSDPTQFTVLGTDAHAWPEVYFRDFGWIAFEPTPRDDGEAVPPAYTEPPIPTDGIAGLTGGPGQTPSSADLARGVEPGRRAGAGLSLTDQTVVDGAPGQFRWEQTFTRIALGVLAAVALFLIAVPLLKQAKVRQRYRSASGPVELASAAFAEFEEEATELASPRLRAESAPAYARRVAGRRSVSEPDAVKLARIYEAAQYALTGVRPGEADEAKTLARRLRARLWANSSWWDRAQRLFSVRGLRRAA